MILASCLAVMSAVAALQPLGLRALPLGVRGVGVHRIAALPRMQLDDDAPDVAPEATQTLSETISDMQETFSETFPETAAQLSENADQFADLLAAAGIDSPFLTGVAAIAVILATRVLLQTVQAVKPLLVPALGVFVALLGLGLATELSAQFPFLGDPIQIFLGLFSFTVVGVTGGIAYFKTKEAVEDVSAKVSSALPSVELPRNPFRTPDEASYVKPTDATASSADGGGFPNPFSAIGGLAKAVDDRVEVIKERDAAKKKK